MTVNLHPVPFLAFLVWTLGIALTSGQITGKIFRVDVENRRFDLLKETEYDPKSDVGRSRFPCEWTKDAVIQTTDEPKSFAGIKGPVWTKLEGIDAANRKAIAERKPFVARVATLFVGTTSAPEQVIADNEVTGWFTPTEGKDSRSGTIMLEGKEVAVSLRDRNWRIFRQAPLSPDDLAKGFWQVSLEARTENGVFVANRIDATPLPDPRLMDDPKLPRVLVIGDSISMNYHDAAKAALAGVANYHRNEGNSMSSAHGVRNAELWLGNFREPGFQWDVILFNHGLHDLKQEYDKATDRFGAYSVPPDAYKANLEKLIGILERTGATLVWTSTTPVPNDNKSQYARRKGADRDYNALAMEVIKKHPEILINDLHQFVDKSPAFDAWRKTIDVHFYQDSERKLLGDAVAAAVRKALQVRAERPTKKLPVPGEVFSVDGHTAFLIRPLIASANPMPWVWYAPTLQGLPGREETWMIQHFLERGIAVAGIDVGESMGNPEGRALFTQLHSFLTEKRDMSSKPVLLCRSRGGLMHYNWAAEHPDKVRAIAGIYPVGNLASWPGLAKAAPAYGMSAAELEKQLVSNNPVDRLAPLAKARIPILHVHGDKDGTVPLEQNSGLIHERYKALDGDMTLVVIPGGGHDMNPHWFQNQQVVDFVISRAR